jgi:predicted AAA+ superfamily ATPase
VQVVVGGHVQRDARPVLDRLVDEEPAILLEGPRGSGKWVIHFTARLA